MTLVHLPENIKAEFSVNEKGEVSTSIRGCARLINIDESGLRKNFVSGCGENPSKMAQTLIDKGFNLRTFSEDGIPDTAFVFICEYYAFEAGQRCTEEAKNLYRAFAAIGFRTWVQKELGWQPSQDSSVESEAIAKIGAAITQIGGAITDLSSQINRNERMINDLRDEHLELCESLEAFRERVQPWIGIDFKFLEDHIYQFQMMDATLRDILLQRREAEKFLNKNFPDGNPSAEATLRTKVNSVIRAFAIEFNLDPAAAYDSMYCEFRRRYHYDVKARCRNKNHGPLDQFEKDGRLSDFYNLTTQLINSYRGLVHAPFDQ